MTERLEITIVHRIEASPALFKAIDDLGTVMLKAIVLLRTDQKNFATAPAAAANPPQRAPDRAAPPASATLPAGKPLNLRTHARLDVMKWALDKIDLGRRVNWCLDAVNNRPGPKMTMAEVAIWLAELTPAPTVSEPAREAPTSAVPARVEPSAPATGSVQPPRQPGRQPSGPAWRTAERDEMIRRDYPGRVPTQKLLAALNALPGPPMTSNWMGTRAAALGVRRPVGWDPRLQCVPVKPERPLVLARAPEVEKPTENPAGPLDPAPRVGEVFATTAPLSPAPTPHRGRTPQRETTMRSAYAAGGQPAHIHAELNELPGAPLSLGEIVSWIGDLDLKRSTAASPRTAERETALRHCTKHGDGMGMIVEIMNSFPGPKMGADEVRAWVDALGLAATARPPTPAPGTGTLSGAQNSFGVTRPAPKIAAFVPPSDPTKKPTSAPIVASAPTPQRTPERERYLLKKIAERREPETIASVLNSFPGARMTAAEIRVWMRDLTGESSAA